ATSRWSSRATRRPTPRCRRAWSCSDGRSRERRDRPSIVPSSPRGGFVRKILLLLPVLLAVLALPRSLVAQEGPVRHVVVFKFKQGATEAQVREVTDALRALKDRIPGILAFEHGVNDSPEGKDQGFT